MEKQHIIDQKVGDVIGTTAKCEVAEIDSNDKKIVSFSFSIKKFFGRENIQINTRSFFPFPETAHEAQNFCGAVST